MSLLNVETNMTNAIAAEQHIQALTIAVMSGELSLKSAQIEADALRAKYAKQFKELHK